MLTSCEHVLCGFNACPSVIITANSNYYDNTVANGTNVQRRTLKRAHSKHWTGLRFQRLATDRWCNYYLVVDNVLFVSQTMSIQYVFITQIYCLRQWQNDRRSRCERPAKNLMSRLLFQFACWTMKYTIMFHVHFEKKIGFSLFNNEKRTKDETIRFPLVENTKIFGYRLLMGFAANQK